MKRSRHGNTSIYSRMQPQKASNINDVLTIEFMLRMWISLTNSYRNLLSECVNGKVNIVDPDQTECAVVSVSRNEPSTEKIRKISGKFMTYQVSKQLI